MQLKISKLFHLCRCVCVKIQNVISDSMCACVGIRKCVCVCVCVYVCVCVCVCVCDFVLRSMGGSIRCLVLRLTLKNQSVKILQKVGPNLSEFAALHSRRM